MKTKKIKSILFFIFLYIFIDLSLTQLFFTKFYNSKLEKRHASDLENRILNKDYKYTFANKKIFKSNYQGNEYTIKTNNLGFRDFRVRDLDVNNNYTIVIGDSMVEGVPFEFEDSLVGYLNKKLVDQQIEKHEFLFK
jgi:regulatory protein YycI of two-component signal transduction system YycFG